MNYTDEINNAIKFWTDLGYDVSLETLPPIHFSSTLTYGLPVGFYTPFKIKIFTEVAKLNKIDIAVALAHEIGHHLRLNDYASAGNGIMQGHSKDLAGKKLSDFGVKK